MTKTIDVTLTTMENVGPFNVSPKGLLQAQIVRAVDDKEIHQAKELYFRPRPEQPMHPNGTTHIIPGRSLSFNVTQQLTVNSEEMLILFQDMTESEHQIYSPSRRQVRFDDIEEFMTVPCDYTIIGIEGISHKIIALYTVHLVFDDQNREARREKTY